MLKECWNYQAPTHLPTDLQTGSGSANWKQVDAHPLPAGKAVMIQWIRHSLAWTAPHPRAWAALFQIPGLVVTRLCDMQFVSWPRYLHNPKQHVGTIDSHAHPRSVPRQHGQNSEHAARFQGVPWQCVPHPSPAIDDWNQAEGSLPGGGDASH